MGPRVVFRAPNHAGPRLTRGIANLIQSGYEQLAAHQYVVACDSFRQATEKAIILVR